MPESGWEIRKYVPDELPELLSNLFGARRTTIERKLHLTYLNEYLPKMGVETILVEREYVDRDFLEDFAAYYVRCFAEYPRFCARLHFFAAAFEDDDFQKMLDGSAEHAELQLGYRGFMVVKPLPETIVGRTCLATYDEGGRRSYPTIRACDAHLFGMDFPLKSLPFQEQDTAVARCATSALWSMFHATADLFRHAIPTPVSITRSATAHGNGRALPNHGLTGGEVAAAIKSCGLEPHAVNVVEQQMLQMTVYAYLRARIPLYLSFYLVDVAVDPHEEMGRHAVAVTGYSLPPSSIPVAMDDGLLIRALRLDKLYVHDDGVGPFARMEFGDEVDWVDAFGDPQTDRALSTSWCGASAPGQVGTAKAVPITTIIPLYHKIRVQFDSVLAVVGAFNAQLEQLRQGSGIPGLNGVIEWDIFLSQVSDFKRDIRRQDLPSAYKRSLLAKTMPRFLWRAIGNVGDARVLELVFDATDLEQGSFVSRVVEYLKQGAYVLRRHAPALLARLPEDDRSVGVFEWFAAQAD